MKTKWAVFCLEDLEEVSRLATSLRFQGYRPVKTYRLDDQNFLMLVCKKPIEDAEATADETP